MRAHTHQQEDEWLNAIINALNVDYSTEFVLTRAYLHLYSKEHLLKLAKEGKFHKASTAGA